MPAGFHLRKDPQDTAAEFLPISSITVAANDLLVLTAGATTWVLGTSSHQHWHRKAIALEAATTAETEIKAVIVNPEQTFEAQSANASNSSHNGDRMVLTDENTVNNTGTDSTAEAAVVVQVGVVGATSENRILVKFLGGTGVDPDAA